MKPSEQWVRNVDDRGNVYYYNVKTGKSRWLPPCSTCGKKAERWCVDCGISYCVKHYESYHIGDTDKSLSEHVWTLTEEEKEALRPGETHCIECKRRKAVEMCTTCWDPYCIECFKFTHKSGNLRTHKTIDYRRAKKGWICVKAREEGEQDYYVNGTTGETTYEKPIALMTPQEQIYYKNFQLHKEAATKYVEEIGRLQTELEKTAYDRDRILFEAVTSAPDANQPSTSKPAASSAGNRSNGFGGGGQAEYRQYLLQPNNRKRGKERSDYIKGLLDSVAQKNSRADP